jgi:hypothetical protein
VSDREAWLSNAREHVSTAQHVLSEVERGLATAEKVEHVAKRARPALRAVSVVVVGGLVAVGIVVLVRRRHGRPDQAPRVGGPGTWNPDGTSDEMPPEGGAPTDRGD